MKKANTFLVTVALLALLAGTAWGEVYVELYIGGNFGANYQDPFFVNPAPGWGATFTPKYTGNIDPAFLGGLKVGTWFVKEGFLGFNYPAWMRFLGFYVDFNFHRLNLPSRTGTKGINFGHGHYGFYQFNASSEGTAATIAFMFAFRYGLLPDKEVPFGRLQPYVAVGPALLLTTQEPTAMSPPINAFAKKDTFPSDTSDNLALAVEAGLRWMALKNVSIDVAFRYRYAHPHYLYHVVDEYGNRHMVRMDMDLHLFSVILGAAYHF